MNERPIETKPIENTDPVYLSPNSLYLCCCSDRITSGPFQSRTLYEESNKGYRSQFLLVQSITDQFWKIWQKLYFPS